MSAKDPVSTVDDTGRDRADWDRIEQVLLQQPPAAAPSDTATTPREGERTPSASGGADGAASAAPALDERNRPQPPAPRPDESRPTMTTADVAAAGDTPPTGQRPAGAERTTAAATTAAATADAVEEPRRAVEERDTGEDEASSGALFAGNEADEFRSRWNGIQAAFVDDPRESVHEADALVAEVMKQLAATFAAERSGLESQWSRGDDVSTEDLRQALRRYRSFFDRLLSF